MNQTQVETHNIEENDVIGLEDLSTFEAEKLDIISQAYNDDTLELIDEDELAHNIEAEGELAELIRIENELGLHF